MADFLTPFDPTAAASGSLPVQMGNGGWLMVHNVSPTILGFKVGIMTAPVLIPAFTARSFAVPLASTVIKWTKMATLNTFGVPISQVYIEAYQPNEWNGGELYLPLAQSENPQPRNIDIPPGIQNWTANEGLTGGANSEITLQTIGLSPANLLTNRIGVYVNSIYFQLGLNVVGQYEIGIELRIRTAALVTLSSTRICFWQNVITAGQLNGEEMRREYPMPLSWEAISPNFPGTYGAINADHVALVVHQYSGPAGGLYTGHASWWLDLNNADVIAAPGNAAYHVTPNAYY